MANKGANMGYVVGVDGGGSKTTAAVVGDGERVAGEATSGPANFRSVGLERASANIANSIRGAVQAAHLTLDDVDAICMCLAGFDTDLDLPVPQRASKILGYSGKTIYENDVVGAWAGATDATPGIVIIAGTGSTGLGMNQHGELWRTDGWDYLLGDAGSGYNIGEAGIRAAMRALDRRGPPTLLVRLLGQNYGVRNAEEMRRLVDSTQFGKFEVASFAVHVSHAADAGDSTAQHILHEAGELLADNAIAIIRTLDMGADAFPISTVGSVFKATEWVVKPFQQVIQPFAAHAEFVPPRHPPQVGAAIMARRRLAEGDVGSWTIGTGRRRIGRSATVEEVGHV
jgi:N-acetylglucosamine kinase-like BadF-type ATPase